MALGTPCISTDVTGIPEIVRDGETGLLVPQREAKATADAIERMFDDLGLRRRVAQTSRSLVEEQFDIHRNTAVMRELFAAPRQPVAAVPAGAR
jgi:glycosyltransferase involved in cell wall biosynthesis